MIPEDIVALVTVIGPVGTVVCLCFKKAFRMWCSRWITSLGKFSLSSVVGIKACWSWLDKNVFRKGTYHRNSLECRVQELENQLHEHEHDKYPDRLMIDGYLWKVYRYQDYQSVCPGAIGDYLIKKLDLPSECYFIRRDDLAIKISESTTPDYWWVGSVFDWHCPFTTFPSPAHPNPVKGLVECMEQACMLLYKVTALRGIADGTGGPQ